MTAPTIAAAAALVWFGMVVAISFLEAPLKFRAPGITVPLGLGIGRIVFRALNIAEAVLATICAIALAVTSVRPDGTWWLVGAIVVLALQIGVVRPVLTRRSNRVLAGTAETGRSRAHLVYVAFELVKIVALLTGALLILAAA